MKCRRITQLGPLVAAAVLALGLATRGYGQTASYELCIEQSPAQAGKLSPDSGVHRFSTDTVVVLSAEPQPGYQFAYWLGDVADPKAQRTVVRVNSSKVIVAIFQPVHEDYPEQILVGGGGGGGGTVPTRIDLGSPAYSLAGGAPKSKPSVVPTAVPVPVPEPATIVLLGAGILALRRHRR